MTYFLNDIVVGKPLCLKATRDFVKIAVCLLVAEVEELVELGTAPN